MNNGNEQNEFVNSDKMPARGLREIQNTPQDEQNVPKFHVSDFPCSDVPAQTNGPETPLSCIPDNCPICGSALTWSGVHLICDAPNCIAKLIVSLEYFYSQKGIKIDGIGAATIEKILLQPKCYEVLKDRPWALLDMFKYDILAEVSSVLGNKTFDTLYSQVTAASGTKTMAHFVAGLGLPGLAYKTALRLCQFLKTGKLNIHVSAAAKDNFIKAVNKYNQAMNEMLGFKFAPLPSPAKAIYCVTGTLSMSREAFIEKMSALGYEFSAGVTRETNYLIVGEEPGKTKIAKAERYNLPQITENQFNKLITDGD